MLQVSDKVSSLDAHPPCSMSLCLALQVIQHQCKKTSTWRHFFLNFWPTLRHMHYASMYVLTYLIATWKGHSWHSLITRQVLTSLLITLGSPHCLFWRCGQVSGSDLNTRNFTQFDFELITYFWLLKYGIMLKLQKA